jgi:hypothetical protein
MARPNEGEKDVSQRQEERKRKGNDAHGPAHVVVGEHGGIAVFMTIFHKVSLGEYGGGADYANAAGRC